MVFQGVGWTTIADGMSSAEVEIAKVTLMIRMKNLEYDDSINSKITEMLFHLYKNIFVHVQTLGNLALDGGWIAFAVVLIILVAILLVYCKKRGIFKDIDLNCL